MTQFLKRQETEKLLKSAPNLPINLHIKIVFYTSKLELYGNRRYGVQNNPR